MELAGNGCIQLGDGTLEIIWFFKTDATLSNATDRDISDTIRGIADGLTFGGNSIALRLQDNVNAGAMQMRVFVAGVLQANTNGTTTLVASTKYHVRFVITASSIKYYTGYRLSGGAETLEGTYVGAQPSSAIAMGTLATIGKSAGTTGRHIFLDGWQYNYTFTNQR